MRAISVEELKQIQLDMLVKIDEFCRKNNIEYFLDGGSGIGVVRHKGFIPWDDDIDLGMTRPNYEKFIHSFQGAYEHLDVYAPELDWNFYANFANVCDNRTYLVEPLTTFHGNKIGVKIDLFPFDGTDSDFKKSLKIHRRQRRYLHLLSRKRRNLKTVWKTNKINFCTTVAVRTLTCFLSYSWIQKRAHHNATRYNIQESEYAYDIANCNPHFVWCPRSAFDEYIDMEFEGKKVRMIKGYDTYLTALFGDYMTLPPEKERVAQHGFVAYWLEEGDKISTKKRK